MCVTVGADESTHASAQHSRAARRSSLPSWRCSITTGPAACLHGQLLHCSAREAAATLRLIIAATAAAAAAPALQRPLLQLLLVQPLQDVQHLLLLALGGGDALQLRRCAVPAVDVVGCARSSMAALAGRPPQVARRHSSLPPTCRTPPCTARSVPCSSPASSSARCSAGRCSGRCGGGTCGGMLAHVRQV